MDTYIVRIYRRSSFIDGQWAGVCEHVEKEKEVSFESIEQLVEEIIGCKLPNKTIGSESEEKT